MSKNTPDNHTFTAKTERLNILRTAETQQNLGSLTLSSNNAYKAFSDLMNSTPADGLSAIYALGGQIPPEEVDHVIPTSEEKA